jgi:hypothetical protein
MRLTVARLLDFAPQQFDCCIETVGLLQQHASRLVLSLTIRLNTADLPSRLQPVTALGIWARSVVQGSRDELSALGARLTTTPRFVVIPMTVFSGMG